MSDTPLAEWYVGFPREFSFILGPLPDGVTVFLDYWRPSAPTVVVSVDATIVIRATGACTAPVTPDVPGLWRFQPRAMSGAEKYGASDPWTRYVYPQGTIPKSRKLV